MNIQWLPQPGQNNIEPIGVQTNLNSMVPYINQILESLPATEKVAFLKDEQYPNGTFVLVTSAGITPIVPQYLLTRLQETAPKAYILAQGQQWEWSIANQTDISINDLENQFEEHTKKCLNEYISSGDALNYKMNFIYKVVASVPNAPQVTASSSIKFHFTVKEVKKIIIK
ncbi:hypothetical protein [Spiroplasma endosymbiont of Danaus chrysippus]|uniref:hypothetical protein n=1 Tax=Spiroplasma endosymbiont of Danaus chrysippus TaxID=2691041 RepID=UPI00157BA464|nr:hypothetical protein [Spiroplasma endosymbiont of Danaus chrysippus]